MKLGLRSDFDDFYDHWFCPSHEDPDRVFDRMSRTTMRKRDQFELLEKLEFNTPRHGIVRDWVLTYSFSNFDSACVVVYTDELAHAGEGKILVSPQLAVKQYPDHYASFYIKTTSDGIDGVNGTAESYRLLQIGSRNFYLRYRSEGSWQSNSGNDVQIELMERQHIWEFGEREGSLLKGKPLFAIDFVKPLDANLSLAIDFNTAPGLKNTGIEETVTSWQIYTWIEQWIRWNL